jgi:thiol-disulfide isomerase/thioredoxin
MSPRDISIPYFLDFRHRWVAADLRAAAGDVALRKPPPGGRRPPLQLLLVIALTLLGALPARAQVKAGDAFPALATAGLTNGTLPATMGQVVLVDFWASWCAPCKASFPSFAKLQADYAPRGLVIVAVSVDEKVPDYEAFIRKLAPPFATLLDQGHVLVAQVKVPTMPTSYLLGRDGRVRFVHVGFHGSDTDHELRKEIETLLSEKI